MASEEQSLFLFFPTFCSYVDGMILHYNIYQQEAPYILVANFNLYTLV
jgi:hypothetical protein